MMFDNFYLLNAVLENDVTNFSVKFEKEDRFYSYLMPILRKGKANGLTTLVIDSLTVPKIYYNKLCAKAYKMTAQTMFEQKQKDDSYLLSAGCTIIDKVCFKNVNTLNIKPVDNDRIEIKMCKIEILYQSDIQYEILVPHYSEKNIRRIVLQYGKNTHKCRLIFVDILYCNLSFRGFLKKRIDFS